MDTPLHNVTSLHHCNWCLPKFVDLGLVQAVQRVVLRSNILYIRVRELANNILQYCNSIVDHMNHNSQQHRWDKKSPYRAYGPLQEITIGKTSYRGFLQGKMTSYRVHNPYSPIGGFLQGLFCPTDENCNHVTA